MIWIDSASQVRYKSRIFVEEQQVHGKRTQISVLRPVIRKVRPKHTHGQLLRNTLIFEKRVRCENCISL